MSLVTPDLGLLFWTVIIFGIVLAILWKYGFPMITGMVEKRADYIDESLRQAREAEDRMKGLAQEQQQLLDDTSRRQSEMLREAAKTRDSIIQQAREEARKQSESLIEKARIEIAAEKESAMRDIRRDVARLSVQIAEKLLREELSPEHKRTEYLDRVLDEVQNNK